MVGECLAKIVQLYGWQLLDHRRWEEDLGRVEASKRLFADVAFLEKRFEGLMGDESMWPKIKTYVLTPLEQVGHLMAGGEDGWMAKAVEHLDMYDAGKAARAQPKWVPVRLQDNAWAYSLILLRGSVWSLFGHFWGAQLGLKTMTGRALRGVHDLPLGVWCVPAPPPLPLLRVGRLRPVHEGKAHKATRRCW